MLACDLLVFATPIYSWYCKHANLRYLGLLAGRDMGYDREFMDEEKEARARAFAEEMAGKLVAG